MSLKQRLRDTSKDVIKIEALEDGGFKMECSNPDGTEWGNTYYGMVDYEGLKSLHGKMLTIIDSAISDKEQRKALKDIVSRTIWFDWVQSYVYMGKEELTVSMPIVNPINNSIN